MSTGSLDRVIFSPDSNVAWTLQTSYPKNGKYLDPITAPCGNVDSSYAIRHIAIKMNKAVELTMGVVVLQPAFIVAHNQYIGYSICPRAVPLRRGYYGIDQEKIIFFCQPFIW